MVLCRFSGISSQNCCSKNHKHVRNKNTDIPLFVSKEDTNGIFYIDVLFPFDNLAPEYVQHIPFLSDVITNLGWDGKGWDVCTQESSCVMGDIWGRTLCGAVSNAPACLAEAEKYSR